MRRSEKVTATCDSSPLVVVVIFWGARVEEKGCGNRVIHINNICKWSSGEGGGATSLLFFLIKLSNLGATLTVS